METAPTLSVSHVAARVRAWLASTDKTRAELAEEAGVDEKTIRLAASDTWNPTKNTLQKLEALVPADWTAKPSKKRARAA